MSKEIITLVVKAKFQESPTSKDGERQLVRILKDEIDLCSASSGYQPGRLVVQSVRRKNEDICDRR